MILYIIVMKNLLTISLKFAARSIKKRFNPPIAHHPEHIQSSNKLQSLENVQPMQNRKQKNDKKFMKESAPVQNKKMVQFEQRLEKKVLDLIGIGLSDEEIIEKLSLQAKKQESKEQILPFLRFQNNEDLSEEKKIGEQMRIQQEQNKFIDQLLKNKKNKELYIGDKYKHKPENQEEQFIRKENIISSIRKRIPINISFEQYESLLTTRSDIVSQPETFLSSYSNPAALRKMKNLILNEEQHQPKNAQPLSLRIKKEETFEEALEKRKKQKEQKKMMRAREEELFLVPKENNENSVTQNFIELYKDQEYYIEKGMREYKVIEGEEQENIKLREIGEKDSESSMNYDSIFLEENIDKKKSNHILKTKEEDQAIFQASTFGMQERRLKEIEKKLQNHGIQYDLQELKQMNKEILFADKKQREEKLGYEKYLQKKEKKKKMNQLMNKIHQQKLRDNLDFQKNTKQRYKDLSYDPLNFEENFKRYKEQQKLKEAVLEKEDKKSQIYFTKLELKLRNFLESYFHSGLNNPNSTITEKFEIVQFYFNKKKTLIQIFWKFKDNKFAQNEEEIKKTNDFFNRSSTYISGKIAQFYDLRYGPEIRFHFDEILPSQKELKKELEKNKEEVINEELKSLKKRGLIKSNEVEKDYRQKLNHLATFNLTNFHNRKILLSKQYQKKQRQKQRKEKQAKKPAKERLWDEIDKL